MRYRLRTLLIAVAIGPPLIAGAWWGWGEYVERRERQKTAEQLFWRELTISGSRHSRKRQLEIVRRQRAILFGELPPEGGGVVVDPPAAP